MVRNIAGVLIAIGTGERPMDWAREVLAARDRTLGRRDRAARRAVSGRYSLRAGTAAAQRTPSDVRRRCACPRSPDHV